MCYGHPLLVKQHARALRPDPPQRLIDQAEYMRKCKLDAAKKLVDFLARQGVLPL